MRVINTTLLRLLLFTLGHGLALTSRFSTSVRSQITINALLLAEHLPNAQLIVYSDSSHGAQYQNAKLFLEHVKLFLSGCD